MALSNLLNFIAWRYKDQCKRFLIMKWTYKNWKTLFSGNLKFKKMNSYSHKIRLQWAVWQAGQVWRQITGLPQWISLITDWQVLPSSSEHEDCSGLSSTGWRGRTLSLRMQRGLCTDLLCSVPFPIHIWIKTEDGVGSLGYSDAIWQRWSHSNHSTCPTMERLLQSAPGLGKSTIYSWRAALELYGEVKSVRIPPWHFWRDREQ